MANTNKGRKFFLAMTTVGGSTPSPQANDIASAAAYAALNWVEVKNVGMIGETGTQTNILSYDELGTDVTQKNKGISNAGDPVIEVARNQSDNGQIGMRAAGLTKLFYAFKIEDDDIPSGGSTPTRYYMRGLVNGPVRPNGRVEDFILEVFTLGLVQREIVANAA